MGSNWPEPVRPHTSTPKATPASPGESCRRTAIVKWYDRKRFCRMHPDVLTYVSHSVQDYNNQQAAPRLPRPGQG
jgi:hypothetical protein